MRGLRARLDYLLKHNHFVNKVFTFSVSLGMKCLGIFISIDKKMIIFSGHSRRYNDSPRALYEYLLENNETYGTFKCVWALEDISQSKYIPGNPIVVKSDTLKYFIYTLKAKYWVTCVNIERGLNYKKKGCRYLNTWHGIPLKAVGNDAGGRKDYNFESIDYFCYSGEYDKRIYKRAFNVKESALIPTGLPRNDCLYSTSAEDIKAIKKKLNLPLDKRIILYAPTWRDSTDRGRSCELAPPINPTLWETELKDSYVVLFRMHAYTNKLTGIKFNNTLRDYSEYPDINDLFKISDILISDYSASIVDFAILERPIICFAYDYDSYKKDRGLYIDFTTDLPNGIIRTERELLDCIHTMDYEDECKKTRFFLKSKMLTFGGDATKKCLDYLFS